LYINLRQSCLTLTEQKSAVNLASQRINVGPADTHLHKMQLPPADGVTDLFDLLPGLVLFLCLTSLALWRVSWGAVRDHPPAPAIAGAIAGFWMVGLFDSLLDVPRVAFWYYFLVLIAVLHQPDHSHPLLAPRMPPGKV